MKINDFYGKCMISYEKLWFLRKSTIAAEICNIYMQMAARTSMVKSFPQKPNIHGPTWSSKPGEVPPEPPPDLAWSSPGKKNAHQRQLRKSAKTYIKTQENHKIIESNLWAHWGRFRANLKKSEEIWRNQKKSEEIWKNLKKSEQIWSTSARGKQFRL